MNLRKMELVVFRDPVNGEYRSSITLTSGTIAPLAFLDVLVDVRLRHDRLLELRR